MSSQKGNISRTRTQKHTNKRAFKNDLHDTSHTIKQINSLEISNVCGKCKGVLEWKIKYKKYKFPKAASTCVVCHQKNVKHAYHTLCTECSTKANVCPKCGKAETLVVPSAASFDESILKSGEIKESLKSLPERRRRTFMRFVEKTLAMGSDDSEKGVKEIILEKLKEISAGQSGGSEFDDFESNSDDEGEED